MKIMTATALVAILAACAPRTQAQTPIHSKQVAIDPASSQAPLPRDTTNGVGEPGMKLRPQIAAWLDQHGYRLHHRNAILKLIWHESRFVPGVIARSGSACLLQWVGDRKAHVFRSGRCIPWQQQLKWMDWELHHEAAYAAFLHTSPQGNAYDVLYRKFGLGQ